MWQTRLEACIVGVHRPTVAGIHGGEGGCYSIALSGGYDDDIDIGECFTYTGEGGRDLKGTKSNPKVRMTLYTCIYIFLQIQRDVNTVIIDKQWNRTKSSLISKNGLFAIVYGYSIVFAI